MFKAIPLFAIPLIVNNLMMLSGGIQPALAGELFAFDLMSGAHWTFSVHDAFIAAGVLILYFEIFKATRTGVASVPVAHQDRTGRIDPVPGNGLLEQQGPRLATEAAPLAGVMRAIEHIVQHDPLLGKSIPKIGMHLRDIVMSIEPQADAALIGDHDQHIARLLKCT